MTTCLLNIDMINDFLWQQDADQIAQLVYRTNELVGAFRAAELPIIWVRQEFASDLSDAFLEMRDRGTRIAISGTLGAQFDERLDRQPVDFTLVKKRYSAFFGTGLDAILDALSVGEIVISGVNTHACVRAAAIDAYQRDLRVILAIECMGSYDPAHAQMSINYMDGKIGRAMSNAEIEAYLLAVG